MGNEQKQRLVLAGFLTWNGIVKMSKIVSLIFNIYVTYI